LVADGSVVFVVVEPSVAALAAGAFPGLGFGVTGAVAATALASVARFVGSALARVALSITGAVTATLAAAGITIFAVVVAAAVAVPVAGVAVVVVGVGLESVFAGADAAACTAPACELAAMAAAAIANGAVELPEAGGIAGTFVAVVVGIVTATGIGVVAVKPACWTRMVRSVADASPFADLSVDFVESAFDAAVDFAWDDWVDWVAAGVVGPLLLALLT
jgi:hypothetical protein